MTTDVATALTCTDGVSFAATCNLLFLHRVDRHLVTHASMFAIAFAINIEHDLYKCSLGNSRPTRVGCQNWDERSYRYHGSIPMGTRTDLTIAVLIVCSRPSVSCGVARKLREIKWERNAARELFSSRCFPASGSHNVRLHS